MAVSQHSKETSILQSSLKSYLKRELRLRVKSALDFLMALYFMY
jgi:hypothetical protein